MDVCVVTGLVIAVSLVIVEISDTSANSEASLVPGVMAVTIGGGLTGVSIFVVIPEDEL